jgi:hypothetical protein
LFQFAVNPEEPLAAVDRQHTADPESFNHVALVGSFGDPEYDVHGIDPIEPADDDPMRDRVSTCSAA